MEGLKALNGFEPSLQLTVVTLNEIRCLGTFCFEPFFCLYVVRKFFCMLEDTLEDSELQRVIVVSWRSPTNVAFEVLFAEDGYVKDVLLDIVEEAVVVLTASYSKVPSDVLEEVNMTHLNEDIRKDVLCSHLDRLIVITRDCHKRIIHILELRKELYPCFKALRGGKEADGNVMCSVINAIEKGNLLLVPLHLHELSVYHNLSSKAFPVAVVVCHIVVVRKSFQFFHDPAICGIKPLADMCSKCADT